VLSILNILKLFIIYNLCYYEVEIMLR